MKILLPVDGSQPSLEAVKQAIALTDQGLEARFVIANVQEPPYLYEMVLAHNAQVIEEVSDSAGQHSLQAAEALLTASAKDYEKEVSSGDPARTLLDIAERFDCDAIIMGARGVGDPQGTSVGSVAKILLDEASIPVMIVKWRTFDVESSESVDELPAPT